MPIAYGDGHYEFGDLVTKIMKEKGMSKEDAGAYVAGIEKNEGKGARQIQAGYGVDTPTTTTKCGTCGKMWMDHSSKELDHFTMSYGPKASGPYAEKKAKIVNDESHPFDLLEPHEKYQLQMEVTGHNSAYINRINPKYKDLSPEMQQGINERFNLEKSAMVKEKLYKLAGNNEALPIEGTSPKLATLNDTGFSGKSTGDTKKTGEDVKKEHEKPFPTSHDDDFGLGAKLRKAIKKAKIRKANEGGDFDTDNEGKPQVKETEGKGDPENEPLKDNKGPKPPVDEESDQFSGGLSAKTLIAMGGYDVTCPSCGEHALGKSGPSPSSCPNCGTKMASQQTCNICGEEVDDLKTHKTNRHVHVGPQMNTYGFSGNTAKIRKALFESRPFESSVTRDNKQRIDFKSGSHALQFKDNYDKKYPNSKPYEDHDFKSSNIGQKEEHRMILTKPMGGSEINELLGHAKQATAKTKFAQYNPKQCFFCKKEFETSDERAQHEDSQHPKYAKATQHDKFAKLFRKAKNIHDFSSVKQANEEEQYNYEKNSGLDLLKENDRKEGNEHTTVGDLDDEFTHIANDADVKHIKNYVGKKADPYDSFFVKTKDGDLHTAYGIHGVVPHNDKLLYKVKGENGPGKLAKDYDDMTDEEFEEATDPAHGRHSGVCRGCNKHKGDLSNDDGYCSDCN